MILIGNMDTLTKASNARGRQLWCSIANLLQKGGNVFPGLPTVCQRHPQSLPFWKHRTSFCSWRQTEGQLGAVFVCAEMRTLVPEKVSHAPGDVNSVIVCTHVTESKCARGHSINTVCGKVPIKCSKTAKVTCQKGHRNFQSCAATHSVSMDCKVQS